MTATAIENGYGKNLFDRFYQPTFFDEPRPKRRTGQFCRVYNDGGHFVAVPLVRAKHKPQRPRQRKEDTARELFDGLYALTLTEGKSKAETRAFLQDNLIHLFEDETAVNAFIDKNIKRKLNNLHHRKKRFRNKANMNRWTHFITITYADDKHTETEFRAKLRKCLSNLHTRHNWRYMGVFERAPETGRLHFHALVYVPENEMIGTITEKQDYSTKQHKMQITHENSFFADRFGRNDFEEISPAELKHGNAISYLLKYIEKTGEKITYSRGIPAELYTTVESSDIICTIQNFVLKYVLFDNVIDWERDIRRCATSPPRGYEPRYIY